MEINATRTRIMFRLLIAVLIILIHNPVYAEVRLWLSATSTDGLIGAGGRAGADAFCDGDANNPGIPASTTRAFISVDAADEIRDMPGLYNIPTTEAIRNQDDTLEIAANFPALLDAGTTPLTNIVGGATNVYTGSVVDGSVIGIFTCLNWTSNNAAESGIGGASNALNQNYITGSAPTCNTAVPIYCISYTAPQEQDEPICVAIKSSNDKVSSICL